jgi:hypothetical protein
MTRVSLAECPPGLFMLDGCLGFKSEYYTDAGWPEAFVVASGEFFWGGAETHEARCGLMVTPIVAGVAT